MKWANTDFVPVWRWVCPVCGTAALTAATPKAASCSKRARDRRILVCGGGDVILWPMLTVYIAHWQTNVIAE